MKQKVILKLKNSFLAMAVFLPFFVHAATPELTVQTLLQDTGQEFELDGAWAIDPGELNPARAHWLLSRELKLHDLKTAAAASVNGVPQVGVQASGIGAKTTVFLQKKSECEGRKEAAIKAANLWHEIVKRRAPLLTLMFKAIQGPEAANVLSRGNRVYDRWLEECEEEWRGKSAQFSCSSSRSGPLVHATPALPDLSLGIPPILARAPVRIWNGLYVIRAEIVTGGKSLVGRFLVDTSTPKTLVNPGWISAQGGNPLLFIDQDARLLKVNGPAGFTVGQKFWIDDIKIAGHSAKSVTGMTEVWIGNTEIFSSPENVSSCCDGVLGADFLRNYAVEFLPHLEEKVVEAGFSGAAVVFHSRKTFVPWGREGKATDWAGIDLKFDSNQELVLDCYPYFHPLLVPAKTIPGLTGVAVSTRTEEGGILHTPWAARFYKKGRQPTDLVAKVACGTKKDQVAFPTIAVELAQNMTHVEKSSTLHLKEPGFTLGMDFFGKVQWVLDISRGKLWIKRSSLAAYETQGYAQRRQESPVDLIFVEDKWGDRVLKVSSIESSLLKKQGLKEGQKIILIDGLDASDLDQWEVDRRVQGVYGSKLSLTIAGPQKKSGKTLPGKTVTVEQ